MYHLRTQKINALRGINAVKTDDKITLSCNILYQTVVVIALSIFYRFIILQSTNQRPRSLFSEPARIAVKTLCLSFFFLL